MPVGFGFSAGDFISGVLLVKDIIKALDNVSGSAAEYDALRGELRALERALDLVSNLPPDTCNNVHQHAIETSVQACHTIIRSFLTRAAKFDATLTCVAGTSQQRITTVSPGKAALRKVQWALLKKEDVVRVRLELSAQVAILTTLLSQTQLLATKNQDNVLAQLHVQMSSQQDRLRQIEALLEQQKQLAEDSRGDLQSFKQKMVSVQHDISSTKTTMFLLWKLGRVVFQMMVRLQKFLVNPVPAQVLLQQVATLEDALGRTAPLHIEWLNSWEAKSVIVKSMIVTSMCTNIDGQVFHSSLEARFKDYPGLTSVKRKDYLVFDQTTDQPVDFSKPWDTVLQPGRKLAMCIVLPRHAWSTAGGTCPRCGSGAERISALTEQLHWRRYQYSQSIKHYKCACALNFCQMRFLDYTARKNRIASISKVDDQHSSRSDAQDQRKSRRHKCGKLKLRRIKTVERDLLHLQRVFVFELEPIEDGPFRRSGQNQNHDSVQSAQLSRDGCGRELGGAPKTSSLRGSEPAPDTADSGSSTLLTEPEESGIYIDADERWDAGSMSSCFTELTGVHRLGAEFEHGRRYHGYHAGVYFQPDDEKAQRLMDISHVLHSRIMEGELHFAPVGNRMQKILDIGTGTGIWALEVADKYPQTRVEGIDLSAVQPTGVPRNVHFYIDDASFLDRLYQDFDFIHVRGLNGCFEKWDEFYKSALHALRPGGWFEQVEHGVQILSQNCLPPDDPIPKLQKILSDASKITGRRFDVDADLHASLERAGFSEVSSRVIRCPIGPWARDKRLKEWGHYAMAYWTAFLEDMFLALMTRFLGWDVQEARAFLATVQSRLRDPKGHLCFRVVVAYGRRAL